MWMEKKLFLKNNFLAKAKALKLDEKTWVIGAPERSLQLRALAELTKRNCFV